MSVVTKSARKSLIWLGAILVAVYALLATGVATNNTTWTPGLALDLAGGRQIILSPVLEEGASQQVDQADLETAVDIIRQRINASGVAESEIAVQGSNIVVSLPGTPSQDTVDMVAQAAQLQFRPVLLVGDPRPMMAPEEAPEDGPAPEVSPDATPTPEAETSPEAEDTVAPEATAEPTTSPAPEQTSTPDVDAAGEGSILTATGDDATADDATADDAATPAPEADTGDSAPAATDASSFEWLTPELLAEYEALDCLDINNLAGRTMGNPNTGHVACAEYGLEKFVLGPVEVEGGDLVTASSGPAMNAVGGLAGGFEVSLQFNSEGTEKFATTTTRLVNLESPRDQFAVVLDGVVITDPSVNTRILNGEASITGNFTQDDAEQLASQLKFGALPLSLEVQSNQQISATLGAEQLEKGIIAGGIGLLLVMVWSLLQYRALGIVVISSLTIVGLATFGAISLLSWGIDYRLSLAGVAGLIIAIGITADSFVVYFERVKDELRDGRSIQSAVDFGWRRARRTILASDAVQLIAAVTLYALAVGGVRGFAFTLGLTTVLDLVVTFMFTYPLLVLLARTNFFGQGHKWSGLDPRQVGRESMYRGRGRVVLPSTVTSNDGLTLAERKVAQRKEKADAVKASATDGEES